MPAFVTFGRILFAVLFIYTGATKLIAIQATADFIAGKIVVPDVVAPYAKQIEAATAMTTPQLLAIAVGGLEFAPNAGLATREQQIIVGMRIQAAHGWGAWGCGHTLHWV